METHFSYNQYGSSQNDHLKDVRYSRRCSLPKKKISAPYSRLHLEIKCFCLSVLVIRDEWDALAKPTALTSRISRLVWSVLASGTRFRRIIFKFVVIWKYLSWDWSNAEVCVCCAVATGWIAAQRGRQMRQWGGIRLRGQGRSRWRRWGGRCRRNCRGNVRETTRIFLGCSQRAFAKSRSAPSDFRQLNNSSLNNNSWWCSTYWSWCLIQHFIV